MSCARRQRGCPGREPSTEFTAMMASSAESIGVNGAAAPTQLFVINLAASTSAMALSHPSSPELKRYTFFVSRQREDGRERFRLHMGYFHSQEEAETLLASVRDVYPAAWAGPAPTTGMGRRGRIAPGSVVSGSPAPVTPAVAAAPAAPAESAAMPAVAAAAPVIAAAPVAAAPVARAAPASPAAAVQPQAAAVPVARAVPAAMPAAAAARPAAASARAAGQSSLPSPSPSPSASTSSSAPTAPPLDAMSNVRDVLAQLSESASAEAPTVPMRTPPVPAPATAPRAASPAAGRGAPPELSPVAALSLLETPARTIVAPPASRAAPAVAKPVSPARSTPAHPPTLPPLKSPFEGLEGEPEVRLVTPEDTQTLTDIKLDRQNNAPPCFAVQLVWSVSPIDVAALPHLAIFEAYTLYNVEGNRQGRRWYGLRLGFFSDPNSATQVANYVRSDYTAVAVVPVAVKERDRAKGGTTPLA